MTSLTRERIALGICVAAAIAGAILILREYKVAWVLLFTSFVWEQVAQWLGRRRWFHRRHETMTQIYQAAKRGNLATKLAPPASYINRAAQALFVAAIAAFFLG